MGALGVWGGLQCGVMAQMREDVGGEVNGPEEKLEETRYCQSAMFIAGLAGAEKLHADREEAVHRAQVVAGLSLGEYTALCLAGVFISSRVSGLLSSEAKRCRKVILRIVCGEAFVAGNWAWIHYGRASVLLACTIVLYDYELAPVTYQPRRCTSKLQWPQPRLFASKLQ